LKSLRKKTGKKKNKYNEPDEFQSLTSRVFDYIREHTRQAYAVLAVVAAVLLLTVGISVYFENAKKQVASSMDDALKYYDLDSAAPGDKPMPAEERMKKAKGMFGEISEKARGPQALVALYYKANAAMELGDLDGAIKGYKDVVGKAADNNIMRSLADARLAEAYLAKGDTDTAVKTYMEIANATGGYMQDEARVKLAGIYEAQGKKREALIEYQAVIKDYPKSPWIPEVSGRILQLSGTEAAKAALPMAGAPAATPAAAKKK